MTDGPLIALTAPQPPARCARTAYEDGRTVPSSVRPGAIPFSDAARDAGDVFELEFQQKILYNDPSFGISFESSNGEEGGVDDPNGETRLSGSGKYLTVEIQEEDIVGDPVTIALPLPVTITAISGVIRASDSTEPSLTCSKDVVLD